jgi:hypothetical protein
MSALGQNLPKLDVRVTSAFPLIADSKRTSPQVSSGPKTEVGVCLDIKAFSRYDEGHSLPLVVAGAAVSIVTNPTRADPG